MAKNVLILGGGIGGTIVANSLARKIPHILGSGEVSLSMLSASDRHFYQPGLLYIPFSRVTPQELDRDQKSLLHPAVKFTVDPAVKIDTEKRTVTTESGRSHDYDYLVLATGSRIVPEEIPGLKDNSVTFYDLPSALKMREELPKFQGGKVVIVVGIPHKCPPAPLEITFMLWEYFQNRGLGDKVEITYTYPIGRVHTLEPVAPWAAAEFDRRGIKYEVFFNMKEVDGAKKQITSEEGVTLDYDLLVAIPPHKGMPVIEENNLGAGGWVPTDRNKLLAEGRDNVFVVGDTTNIPISKAGSTAHFEAEVIADNLASLLDGGVWTRDYDGKVFCFIETGFGTGTYIWFNYETPPAPGAPTRAFHLAKLAYNRLYWLSAKGLL